MIKESSLDNLTPRSSWNAALLLARFELKKILFSTRGMIGLATFALAWALLLWYPIRQASIYLFSPDFKQLLEGVFGAANVGELLSWDVAEMAVLWVAALYLFPIFSLFVGADQFASDKARGSFRFLTLRVSRTTLFFGRVTGYLLIQAILLIMTLVATLLLVAYRDTSLVWAAMGSGVLVFINIMIVLAPFTAMMAILSLHANSARQASIYAVLFLAGSTIVNGIISYYLPGLSNILQWLVPGAQLDMMINTKGLSSLAVAAIPLLQAGVLLLLGRSYMARIAL
ncbi:ABC transporter permease [Shewanella insulae]|uniref:ABC transporter permease subunit n=1 Tax=Shewanella insulae TaxID=2681496 RepID=UPI001EFC6DBD|nr:ABC transporter permease subunit [Shewanella insulae]MCG9711702.1 ABC transporter permease [Shewanella insulae]